MALLLPGRWYTSKIALEKIEKVPIIVGPAVHKMPDGLPVMVFDPGGSGSIVNKVKQPDQPPRLIPQNEEGHDLMTVVNNQVVRVALDPADLPDLKRLVEFDHLPEGRKAGALAEKMHKPGDKLA